MTRLQDKDFNLKQLLNWIGEEDYRAFFAGAILTGLFLFCLMMLGGVSFGTMFWLYLAYTFLVLIFGISFTRDF